MSSSKWKIKPRDYEIDLIKYEVKLNSVQKDQDPLSIDITKLPAKKQIIKSKLKN